MKKKTESNWFKHWRSWHDDPFFNGSKYCDRSAWSDLVQLANYKEGQIKKQGKNLLVMPGMVGWSNEGLSKRWGWSIKKVRNFISRLIDEGWIRWEGPTMGPTMGPTKGPTRVPTRGPTKIPINRLLLITSYIDTQNIGPTTGPTQGPDKGPTGANLTAHEEDVLKTKEDVEDVLINGGGGEMDQFLSARERECFGRLCVVFGRPVDLTWGDDLKRAWAIFREVRGMEPLRGEEVAMVERYYGKKNTPPAIRFGSGYTTRNKLPGLLLNWGDDLANMTRWLEEEEHRPVEAAEEDDLDEKMYKTYVLGITRG